MICCPRSKAAWSHPEGGGNVTMNGMCFNCVPHTEHFTFPCARLPSPGCARASAGLMAWCQCVSLRAQSLCLYRMIRMTVYIWLWMCRFVAGPPGSPRTPPSAVTRRVSGGLARHRTSTDRPAANGDVSRAAARQSVVYAEESPGNICMPRNHPATLGITRQHLPRIYPASVFG